MLPWRRWYTSSVETVYGKLEERELSGTVVTRQVGGGERRAPGCKLESDEVNSFFGGGRQSIFFDPELERLVGRTSGSRNCQRYVFTIADWTDAVVRSQQLKTNSSKTIARAIIG